jgi:predicted RNase H-like HicB family nuclease
MKTVQYTFWQDGEFFIGYLNDYPDYQTQGYSKEELLENLKDLLIDVQSDEVPYIRKVEEMAIAE